MRLRLITKPTAEPLSLVEAARHLRLISSDEEAETLPEKALIQGWITASREAVEGYTNSQLMPATYELILDELEGVTLPKPPFIELVSIHYTTSEGILTPLSEEYYTVLEGSAPCEIQVTTPADYKQQANGVKIRFRCGYEKEETTQNEAGETVVTRVPDVPFSLKAAMCLYIGDFDAHRENTVVGAVAHALPNGAEGCMRHYRYYLGF